MLPPRPLCGFLLLAGLTATGWSLLQAQDGLDAEAPDLAGLTGKTVSVLLKNGKYLQDAEVTKAVPGNEPNSLKSLSVRPAGEKRIQTSAAINVTEIFLEGQPLDVAADLKTKLLKFSPDERRERLTWEERVSAQLEKRQAQLWPELTAEENAEAVAEYKTFLDEVRQASPTLPWNLYETRYYLFFTDMPQAQIAGYVTYLDAMYTQLCKAFGVPEGKNIWRGKCVILAFVDKENFYAFEQKYYNHDATGAQGLCHSHGDGKVIMSCYRGDNPTFFGVVLVHETSHGFVHRVKSSARVPSWVNEGIADWIAQAVVTSDTEVQHRQQEGITRIRQTGSVGTNFLADDARIEAWQYGLATNMVTFLLKLDGKRYRQFIDGIKEGLPPEESLQQSYGMNYQQFLVRYGQSVGVPQLRP
ncbi:hypothetical protein [Planctellipticum variicoloris]|uniref:hypothetical protein n=1 Tax=Planctellipticum variicoloris TaxID=3064265 RepID=UPI0030132A46|nr:hypothetical protein SH412_005029 [Planctomycetaceae bacterium SH412]